MLLETKAEKQPDSTSIEGGGRKKRRRTANHDEAHRDSSTKGREGDKEAD